MTLGDQLPTLVLQDPRYAIGSIYVSLIQSVVLYGTKPHVPMCDYQIFHVVIFIYVSTLLGYTHLLNNIPLAR